MPIDSVNIEKNLYVEYMRNYRQRKAQKIKRAQAPYMREYRKRSG
jgi:hypothetical protein